MSNVSVPNNDQTPNQFQAPNWILNEIPTSPKLQTWANQETNEFGLLSEVAGNTFYNGIPNLAGGMGTLAQLTAQATDGSIAFPAPAFLGGSSLNELQIQNISGASNPYLVTLASGGTISTSNIVVDSTNTSLYLIINTMLVTKNGSGVITAAYPAVFRPTFPTTTPNNTPLNQFYAYFDNAVTLPLTNAYIEVVNYSVSTAAAQSLLNIGGLQYGRIQGFTSGTDITSLLPNTGALPSLTQEINSIENKQFVTQWHAVVNQSSKTGTTGSNFVWNINSTTVTPVWQNGSTPAQGTVVQALTFAPNSIGQASYLLTQYPTAPYACINGIPILTSGGAVVAPGVNISGGNLQLTLPSSIFASSPISNQNIDIYFPVMVPFRMLFGTAFTYNDLNSRITDIFQGVIGSQYGWNNTSSPYNSTPVTIATRLDNLEGNVTALSSELTGIEGYINTQISSINNSGSFSVTTTRPCRVKVTVVGGGGAGGFGNNSSSSNYTNAGGGGGTGWGFIGYIAVAAGTVINVNVGGGGGLYGNSGGSSTVTVNGYGTVNAGGGAGGGSVGSRSAVNAPGGAGGGGSWSGPWNAVSWGSQQGATGAVIQGNNQVSALGGSGGQLGYLGAAGNGGQGGDGNQQGTGDGGAHATGGRDGACIIEFS